MSRSLFELMDDMHLSAQSTFLDYYNAMSANNVELAQKILDNNPELADQITNSENIKDCVMFPLMKPLNDQKKLEDE